MSAVAGFRFRKVKGGGSREVIFWLGIVECRLAWKTGRLLRFWTQGDEYLISHKE